MKPQFMCPGCRAVLNPGDKIVLTVRFQNAAGLILLSPQPGDYQYICDESFGRHIRAGDSVDFSCPICNQDLTSPLSDKLVEFLMIDGDEPARSAQFSRVCGERATFISDGESVEAFGPDTSLYNDLNFSGEERWW